MALYGSSIPLDSGATVVTVICPNAYSHARLMQALNTIVPDAGAATNVAQPATHHAIEVPMPAFDTLQDDDEGAPGEPPRCRTGACD